MVEIDYHHFWHRRDHVDLEGRGRLLCWNLVFVLDMGASTEERERGRSWCLAGAPHGPGVRRE